MSTHGSRYTFGEYQGPATDSAALERGRPLRRLRWERGALVIDLALVPLLHGRPELFEIEYKWNDPGPPGRSLYVPCTIRGESYARKAFARTAAALDAGELPDEVLVPPGTPLGP